MRRTTWIGDLKIGQTVQLQVQIRPGEVRKTQTGAPYLLLTLADKTGTIAVNPWSPHFASYSDPQRARFAEVRGEVSEYKGKLQLNLCAPPREIATPDDLSDFLSSSPLALAELQARLFHHIDISIP